MIKPPISLLRPNHPVSRMIKGGWQLAGDHGSVDQSRAVTDMVAFYDAGILTYDCADIYTGVEAMLGEFLSVLKKTRGEEALQEVKIHTKYVPDRSQLATLKQTDVSSIIDRSLQRLGTEQLDLVQFHWWDYAVPGYMEAMAELQKLQQAGKISQLGVTNFDAERLQELCNSFDIASAQVQYSLLDSRVSGEFESLAQKHSVHLLCYGVLAGGFLTDKWLNTEDPGFEFSNRSLVKYRLIIEEFGGWELFQSLLRTLRKIADQHAVDIDTIAAKSMLDQASVTAVIVGARYAERLPKLLRIFDTQLDETDVSELALITEKSTGPNGPVFGLERDTQGRHGSIMKYNLNSGDTTQLRDATSDAPPPNTHQ